MLRILTCTAVVVALSTAAWATSPHVMTYSEFEESVPHFDLAVCPPSLSATNAFCRVSFHSDAVHVFVFSEEGDQPLIGFRSFDEDNYSLDLK